MELDGKVLPRFYGHSGEIGNARIDPNHDLINNLKPGATESRASGHDIVRENNKTCGKQFKHAEQLFESNKSKSMPMVLAILLANECFDCDP